MSSGLKNRIADAARIVSAAADKPRKRVAPGGSCGKVERRQPEEFRGTIVVILPARDEGPWVKTTIENLQASTAPGTSLQIALFDDASIDKSCVGLASPTVSVRRHRDARGQGVNRNLGVWLHPGADGYVSMDAHMSMSKYGLERLVIDAQDTRGIVGCISRNLSNPNDATRRAGNRWAVKGEGPHLRLGITWNYAGPDDPRLMRAAVPRGACYAFTKDTFNRLGGFGESYGFYGFADHDLAVNAFFKRIPVCVNTSVEAGHLYRVDRPYAMSGHWYWFGYVECLRSMFRPDVWQTAFLPAVEVLNKRMKDPMIDYLLRAPRFDAVQRGYQTLKRRTDEEALKWMGVPW